MCGIIFFIPSKRRCSEFPCCSVECCTAAEDSRNSHPTPASAHYRFMYVQDVFVFCHVGNKTKDTALKLRPESQRPRFSGRGQKPWRMVDMEIHDAQSAGESTIYIRHLVRLIYHLPHTQTHDPYRNIIHQSIFFHICLTNYIKCKNSSTKVRLKSLLQGHFGTLASHELRFIS